MRAPTLTAEANHRLADFAGHPFASVFTSPPWIETLERSYGLKVELETSPSGYGTRSALPFCHVSDVRGERIVILPFSDYCDPLVEDQAEWRALVQPLLSRRVPVMLKCLRARVPVTDKRFERSAAALWHGVDLTRAEDKIWASIAAPARQNVRRAWRAGVSVRVGSSLEDLRIFHRMHCHNRKSKYRLLAQPIGFFEELYTAFGPSDGVRTLVAEVDGTPVAGIVLLIWRDTLYYKFNASTDRSCRPNDLLVWEAIRLGIRLGLTGFDFGLSDKDQPGLVRFKRKFASEEADIVALRYMPRGFSDPRGEAVGYLLKQMTLLLTGPDVPDAVTQAAADELYRYFC
jgi:CelD/BcsL family acetyltransferase involved in cellulose biosynthesis